MSQGGVHGVPIDTDVTLSSNSDLLVPSQKAVKAYVNSVAESVEHEWVSPYSYCGRAPFGSLASQSVWNITRLQVASDGSTTIKHALLVKWDDRLIAIYT